MRILARREVLQYRHDGQGEASHTHTSCVQRMHVVGYARCRLSHLVMRPLLEAPSQRPSWPFDMPLSNNQTLWSSEFFYFNQNSWNRWNAIT